MVRLCRRAICFFITVSSIIFLWLVLQLGYMQTWLDTNIQRTSQICSHIEKQYKQTLEKYKLKNKKLKQLVLPYLPDELRAQIDDFEVNLPVIYTVTPTYLRPTQKAELTRLAQTFLLVPNFHWIIVEDSKDKTEKVSKLLRQSGLKFTHLNVATPSKYKLSSTDPNWLKPRGVLQRNLGLTWLRENFTPKKANGVVYFADDDNTYDLRLFEEMRNTQSVAVWPVGLVGGLLVERPLVKGNKVVGWITGWKTSRPFPIDMAGFAINLKLLLQHPKAFFNITVPRGYQESSLLQKLVTLDQLEPKAENCSKVYVWHTRTEKAKLSNEMTFRQKGQNSNHGIEV